MYPDPHHGEVFVTGDFNGWSAPGFPMQRIEGGWRGEVPDFPQGEFAYKFVVDGHWIADPFNAMTVDDGIGGENSIITHRVNRGSLFHFNFYSPAIDDYRGYVIYLPPGYFLSEDHYSTIYLLHGALDWEYTWAHKGYVHFTMDQLRSQGKAGEMIIVMPKENGEFHGGDNRFADYIYRDLVGHVDFEFKTIAHPKHRAIDGLSTGGFASIVLGSGHPYVFSSVGAMSGSYDQRVFDSIRHNAEAIKKYDVRFHISCGHGDASADVSRALAEAIRSEGIYVEYYQNPGPHDWEFWGPAIAGNLEFHWWSFQR
jgi:enterochelin esterase family protein